MPSKHGDRGHDRDASPERRERRRHKRPRPKRKASSKGDPEAPLERSSTVGDPPSRRKTSMPVPELQRRASSISPNGSKTSLPYPSFSKAHSREAVGSKENITTSPLRKNIFTPDPTDLHKDKPSGGGKEADAPAPQKAAAVNGPPSPPLTADGRAPATEERRPSTDQARKEKPPPSPVIQKEEQKIEEPMKRPSVRVSMTRSATDPKAVSPQKTKMEPPKTVPRPAVVEEVASGVSSIPAHYVPPQLSMLRPGINTAASSSIHSEDTSRTPTAPKPKLPFAPDGDELSPPTGSDSSLKTPTPRATPFPNDGKQTPVYAVPMASGTPFDDGDSPAPPPPPPPPPPPMMQLQAPRVDYLMMNGGLPRPIPKQFLRVIDPGRQVHFSVGELPNTTEMHGYVAKLFAPFTTVLDDFHKVMAKNGSVAVATGYRSIARRLLDRLEAVFARDISSEICTCLMCDAPPDDRSEAEQRAGVSWGEILEYVSGRQELPPWPPFVLDGGVGGAGGPHAAPHPADIVAPMQTLDIDVPDEYREHYIRQSKKTKQSVDRWLAAQPSAGAAGGGGGGAPDDADDDTLTFAILTHLDTAGASREIFRELLGVPTTRPPSIHPDSAAARAPTPLNAPASDLLSRTSHAIRRLYRLAHPPRVPECALFLLNNRPLHNVLATLAAISDAEWDILTSGRFDGFLRSGAEDAAAATPPPARAPTAPPVMGGARARQTSFGTPGPGGRPHAPATPSPLGPHAPMAAGSPATAGAPVALDEETEIAALGEVEREIYMSMVRPLPPPFLAFGHDGAFVAHVC